MNNATLISIAYSSILWVCIGYMVLRSKYPGKGLNVISNLFKETLPFEKAVIALKEGNRIRRKPERKGYTKIAIVSGKSRQEKFGTYYVSDPAEVSDYCSFSIEDVMATDWIIDNEE